MPRTLHEASCQGLARSRHWKLTVFYILVTVKQLELLKRWWHELEVQQRLCLWHLPWVQAEQEETVAGAGEGRSQLAG